MSSRPLNFEPSAASSISPPGDAELVGSSELFHAVHAHLNCSHDRLASLFLVLVNSPNQPVSKARLAAAARTDEASVPRYMFQLRRKLTRFGIHDCLQTILRLGYVLDTRDIPAQMPANDTPNGLV